MHLPLAEADLRAPVSTRLYASDATPTTAAAVSAVVSRAAVDGLYTHAEQKGFYTRLDWNDSDPRRWSPDEWRQRELPPQLLSVIKGATWKVDQSICYKETKHVNIQD